jgi:DNA-binding response OmpR family regulator
MDRVISNRTAMARVVFCGLDSRSAGQLEGLLIFGGHRVRRWHHLAPVADFLNADIVFAGGVPGQYLPLLRRLRRITRALPVIVVAPVAETAAWLDALEAGATDYCVPPFDMRQVRCLMAAKTGYPALSAIAAAS